MGDKKSKKDKKGKSAAGEGGPAPASKGRWPQLLLDFEGERRDIAVYEAAGGYAQLRRAVASLSGDEIVKELSDSGLRGRGGAGFPTGRKASFLAPRDPRYIVVNADESEPGTCKDRELIERDPHRLIEGILIMCWATRATKVFVYIRGEYLHEYEILRAALAQARERGYVGAPLLGSDYVPEIVLHRGAGAYICGEETALLSSLNGYRGQPTAKPPFPAVSGAFRRPTLLNNVETLATVPVILAMGAAAYAEIGTEQSKGTRVLSLSGHVRRPGNYELPFDATLRDLIEGCGGGMPEGRTLKAIIPGGSSAPVLGPSALDVPLAVEALAAAGSMAGSGAVMVIDDRTCMVQLALRTAEFYAHESCGKCTPCREGTRWTVEMLRRVEEGIAEVAELDVLLDLCDNIEGKCLCPLGDACAMPVRSLIKGWRAEFEAHCVDGRCPLYETSSLSSLYPQPRALLPLVTA
jgi:NADH-quinone oxidoreductase subunit F